MQLVIEIPEAAYEQTKKIMRIVSNVSTLDNVIYNAIVEGKPLPEPHGRISDVGKVEKRILEYMDKHKDERGDGAYAALIMLNVETIIPATNAWAPKKIEAKGEEKCR